MSYKERQKNTVNPKKPGENLKNNTKKKKK